MKTRIVMAVCYGLITAGFPHIAAADPPPDITPNPALGDWFKSLRQPITQIACCSISDCRIVAYKVHDGHFEIVINDWKYVVPNDIVLHKSTNPTGEAVACYRYSSFGLPLAPGQIRTVPQDTIEILCFIPPKPSA